MVILIKKGLVVSEKLLMKRMAFHVLQLLKYLKTHF